MEGPKFHLECWSFLALATITDSSYQPISFLQVGINFPSNLIRRAIQVFRVLRWIHKRANGLQASRDTFFSILINSIKGL